MQAHRFAAALEAMADAVILVDPVGRILGANAAAERLLGVSPGGLDGHPIEAFMPAGYAAAHGGWMRRYLAGGAPRIIGRPREVVARSVQGEEIPVRLSVVPYESDGGIGFVGSLHDLRPIKTLESQLHAAQKIEALGVLAAEVAHDLRNMLQVVTGNVEHTLEVHADVPDLHETLDDVLEASRQATSLCQSLLDFARTGEAHAVADIDAAAHIRRLTPVLDRSLGDRHTLQVQVPDQPVVLGLGERALGQILMNLVVNARDAMPDGGAILLTLTGADRRAALRIADEGVGIPAERLDRIFDPFYTTKPAGVGTGLGLSTVFAIVHRAAGRVEVDSAVGLGTTFTVYLPMQEPMVEEAPRRTGAPPAAQVPDDPTGG